MTPPSPRWDTASIATPSTVRGSNTPASSHSSCRLRMGSAVLAAGIACRASQSHRRCLYHHHRRACLRSHPLRPSQLHRHRHRHPAQADLQFAIGTVFATRDGSGERGRWTNEKASAGIGAVPDALSVAASLRPLPPPLACRLPRLHRLHRRQFRPTPRPTLTAAAFGR